MTGVFLNMVGIYLYVMLIRHMSLFKTESEVKLIWNAKILNLRYVFLFNKIILK